jgi:hypothetical protein
MFQTYEYKAMENHVILKLNGAPGKERDLTGFGLSKNGM